MQRDADVFITNVEKSFILDALKDNRRIDGREPFAYRKLQIHFSLDDRSATVHLGSTRVMTVVTAELEAPYPDRPNEGSFKFNVEFSPMASPAFEPGKPGEDAIELGRIIERSLRQSHAIDPEALCVLAGRKVWAVRVDVTVLDHGGNLVDASCLSALAALVAFRKPDVSVGGASGVEITIHPPEVKEPTPLSIHHLPVAVTFALFEDGDLIALDPSLKEEAAQAGSITLVLNPFQEVCTVHKAHGIGLSPDQFMRCMRIAARKVEEIVGLLKAALEAHKVARVQQRVRRHRNMAGAGGGNLALGSSAAVEQHVKQIMAELDIQGGDEDMAASSSSSKEEEDEDEAEEASSSGSEGEAAVAAGPEEAEEEWRRSSKGAGNVKVKSEMQMDEKLPINGHQRPQDASAGATVKTGLPAIKTEGGEKEGGKKKGGAGSKRAVQFNTLDAIAAAIAGTDSPEAAAGVVPDLAAAVKRKPAKKPKS